MSDIPKLAALLHKDARGIYRDRFLLWLCVYPLVLTALMRLALPWIPIEHMALYLAPAAVILSPNLLGMVLGFALIEEREQQTWVLLRVLPLRERTLFGYFVATGALLALLLSLMCVWIYGLPVVHLTGFLALAAANALTAPVLMLLLGAVASNKIEGLALGKIVGTTSMVPALAFVLPASWQWLLGWSPWYWIYLGLLRCFGSEETLASLAVKWPDHPAWAYPTAALGLCVLGLVVFARRYRRQAT